MTGRGWRILAVREGAQCLAQIEHSLDDKPVHAGLRQNLRLFAEAS